MRSAFFDLVVVLMSIAWAMAWSSSRSLDASTDRSSCCSAVIGLLIFWYRKGLRLHRCGEQGVGAGPTKWGRTPIATGNGAMPEPGIEVPDGRSEARMVWTSC